MEEVKRTKAEYRSSIRSKTLIKNALISLMKEKSFDRITVTDIVERADINRGTFYAHYKDVRDVLDKICAGMVDELLLSLRGFDANAIVKDNSAVFQRFSEYISKDIDYFRLLLQVDGIHDFILRKKRDALDALMNSDDVKVLANKKEAEVVLDFALSAIVDTYSDIVLGRISVTLEEAPVFLSKLVHTIISYYPAY